MSEIYNEYVKYNYAIYVSNLVKNKHEATLFKAKDECGIKRLMMHFSFGWGFISEEVSILEIISYL